MAAEAQQEFCHLYTTRFEPWIFYEVLKGPRNGLYQWAITPWSLENSSGFFKYFHLCSQGSLDCKIYVSSFFTWSSLTVHFVVCSLTHSMKPIRVSLTPPSQKWNTMTWSSLSGWGLASWSSFWIQSWFWAGMTQVSSIAGTETYIKIRIHFVLPHAHTRLVVVLVQGCVVLPLIIPNLVGSFFIPLHRPYLYAMHSRPTIYHNNTGVSSIYNFLASYIHSVWVEDWFLFL
jgi:hypothetical protein